jgi:N-glycosylase/DNA lyase
MPSKLASTALVRPIFQGRFGSTPSERSRFETGEKNLAPIPHFSAELVEYQCATRITVSALAGDHTVRLTLPSPDTTVMPGVLWGCFDTLFTPAYWRTQAWLWRLERKEPVQHALGCSLAEEVAACLLGGHGISAEVGLAAFEHLRRSRLLAQEPTAAECYACLSEPLPLRGRFIRYRFARQKSAYLSVALQKLNAEVPPQSAVELRNWLMTLPGFGPKTASWVVRNWLDSDSVAIIDVHLHRAGLIAGFFLPRHSLPTDYSEMEERYLRFSQLIGVRPSVLDALIWRDMREAGGVARNLESRV